MSPAECRTSIYDTCSAAAEIHALAALVGESLGQDSSNSLAGQAVDGLATLALKLSNDLSNIADAIG